MKSTEELTVDLRNRGTDDPLQGKYLYPGQMIVTTAGTHVTTILGSCVSVCLWDSSVEIGGMNHFLLPTNPRRHESDLRYGDVAMHKLVEALVAKGAFLQRLTAKIFGGACVVDGLARLSIGEQNVAVALEFLRDRQIPVSVDETGGKRGRKLIFHTGNGRAAVKEI